MSDPCSWNMHARSDMVVVMGPQHAALCAQAGLSRTEVHHHLCALAGRTVRELQVGGNWRRERALAFPIPVDPDDDVPYPNHEGPAGFAPAGGGWLGTVYRALSWLEQGDRAVHGPYEV